MYSNFPLNIDPKTDSPKRLSLLNGVPIKYFTPASEWNKLVRGLEEVQDFQKESKTSASATLKFDNASGGVVHGNNNPITDNLVIDASGAVEGGMAEVIWSGAKNPNITGVLAASIINIGGTIAEAGIYSIFIMHSGGKYKVNITPKQEQYIGANGGVAPSGEVAGVLTITDSGEEAGVLTITDSGEEAGVLTIT